MPTILHLSDLHRDSGNHPSNRALLQSIELDLERFAENNPDVDAIQIIVVSGDLVQGVHPSSRNPEEELQSQYEQAQEFLVGLTDRFLDRDRNKVVIAPGNHDVDASTFHRSLKAIPMTDDSNTSAVSALIDSLRFEDDSKTRWCWEELRLYQIEDEDTYNRRFDSFIRFYESFYEGTRTYALEPTKQYDLFHYPEMNLVFVTFNSCMGTDLFNTQGDISPECIAGADQEIRRLGLDKEVRIAVWHHGIAGPPKRSDYIDAALLDNFIDFGYSIALHGHHHRTSIVNESYRFGSDSKMTLISAGTLCGSHRTLPHGQRRSYNIIKLDLNLQVGSVFLRSMLNDRFDGPLWGPGNHEHSRSDRQSRGDLQTFNINVIQPEQAPHPEMTVLKMAEIFIRQKDHSKAQEILEPLLHTSEGPIARRFLLECYHVQSDMDNIVKHFDPPASDQEALHLAESLYSLGQNDRLKDLLASPIFSDSTNPAIIEIRDKYMRRLTL